MRNINIWYIHYFRIWKRDDNKMGNITSKTLCPCLWRENPEPSIKHRYHTLLQDLEEIEAAVVTNIQSKTWCC